MGNDKAKLESHTGFFPHHPLLITHPPFQPAWWCRHAHLQTLWAALGRRRPRVALRRERIELSDGDFLDIDWARDNSSGPIVIVLHGLEGSSQSKYALGMLNAITAQGYRGVVMHFRSCSGEPNRLPRSYHSGDTGDLAHIISVLKQREPETPIAVIGYSLGGNVLLKWLGEMGERAPIHAAIAISVPFLLADCAWRMERGVSRIYQWALVRSLQRSVDAKRRHGMVLPLRVTDLTTLCSFREFDEHVTAPLHGFAGADDYYARASSRPYLRHIAIPTLIVHSRDDPFMMETTVPEPAELSAAVNLELYRHGGHVGFISGQWPWRARYWLEQRVPDFLRKQLDAVSR